MSADAIKELEDIADEVETLRWRVFELADNDPGGYIAGAEGNLVATGNDLATAVRQLRKQEQQQ